MGVGGIEGGRRGIELAWMGSGRRVDGAFACFVSVGSAVAGISSSSVGH